MAYGRTTAATLKIMALTATVSSFMLSGYSFYETPAEGGGTVPLRWYQDTVELFTDSRLTRDVQARDALHAVNASIDEWNRVDCPHVQIVNAGTVTGGNPIEMNKSGVRLGTNLVKFENAAEWAENRTDDQSYDTSMTIALSTMFHMRDTGQIVSFGIEFNDSVFKFATEPEEDTYDIQNTMTHELGHVLGLDHAGIETTAYWEQTMFYSADPAETKKRTLGDDDRAGLCDLYSTDWAGFFEPDAAGCSAAATNTGHPLPGGLAALFVIPALAFAAFALMKRRSGNPGRLRG